ncbi:GFA family protein [Sorangium sp. So ce1078]|uniref:GFA family protein n=1 Tax=Sorangium sp. So ce1078 TaxID=3133329 RepID=UPI003F5DD990
MAEAEREAESIWLTGGCQCGRVRYRAEALAGRTGYCHCRKCQRAFGNVFAVLTSHREPGRVARPRRRPAAAVHGGRPGLSRAALRLARGRRRCVRARVTLLDLAIGRPP